MGSAGRVLVVDDDPNLRTLVADVLADEGYEVRAAENGSAALRILQSWRPEAIVLDLMMPVMDGWAFRSEQRARPDLADIPVIVLSATRDVETQARSLQGAVTIPKPFDLDDLVANVERIVPTGSETL